MDLFTITEKNELIKYKNQILNLFKDCFGVSFSFGLWDWAFIETPNGNSVVTLSFDDGDLVGHYAVIPLPLIKKDKIFNCFLSMTTMVAPSHRKSGLFVNLAKLTYRKLEHMNVDFVIGFPNNNSSPGFIKKLSWDVLPYDYIASVSRDFLLENKNSLSFDKCENYLLNLDDNDLKKWRISKPGVKYYFKEGLIYKLFNNSIDLIYYSSVNVFEQLPKGKRINLIVPYSAKEFLPYKVSSYMFGGVSINTKFKPDTVSRQMCLSDVF
jgi:hypothetical protein